MRAPARPSNAYVPAAKRRTGTAVAPAAIEAPGETVGEAIPIFKVGYRKVRSTAIVFPDRRVRCVTPKLAAMETIADNQELLLKFSDAKEAQRQPLKALRDVTAVMREIVPFMVPNETDRDFLIARFDDENVEETDLITAVLRAFAYLMGNTGAAASLPPAPAPAEPEDVPEAPSEFDEFTAENVAAYPDEEPEAA